MDQTKGQKGAGKKAGADGLTKKERRALKLAAAGSDSGTKNNKGEPKPRPAKEPLVKKEQPSKQLDNNKIIQPPGKQPSIKEQANPQTASQVSSNTEVPASNNELSKTELRAQRKEAQRLVKATAKNFEPINAEPTKEAKNTEQPTQKAKNEVPVKDKTESGDGPSKAELRAQRRAIQEAQRLAKTNQKTEQVVKKPPSNNKGEQQKQPKPVEKRASPKKEIVKSSNKHKVPLFNHLYFQKAEIVNLRNDVVNNTGVHAAFIRLGVQYSSKTILGSNARCLALLSALKCLISDFTTPPKQEFCRSLESTLQTCMTYLQNCRPLAVSMTNAVRHFKLYLTQINTNLSDDDKRASLINRIDTYIYDEIFKAGEAISMQVREKVSNGDIILTYGCSSLIKKILLDAHHEGKHFQVIVVDARPLLEGKEMLRTLSEAGIQSSYILINAASFIMSRVSKVILGAHALLANGYVMSRTGTAQVALTANAYKKPVLVCCETYKFCERVQTDSFVYNELGDPDKLVAIDTLAENSPLGNWQNSNYLTLLNLMYDVTPPDLVTAVVTELAFLPCTSVPVILRIRPTEIIT